MLAVHHEIEQARTAYHVVLMVREQVAALSRSELDRLPDACRPKRILDEADVTRLSRDLTRAYWPLRGTAADAGVLHDLWSLFLRAAIQIERLRERGDGKV